VASPQTVVGNQKLMHPGYGSTAELVRHCLYTLRRLLAAHYTIIPITGNTVIEEPWTASCAALVFPGVTDRGFCLTLNGEENRQIRQCIERGGIYIGFCVRDYYASTRCELEMGSTILEVMGDQEQGFYWGRCEAALFPDLYITARRELERSN